MTSDIRSRFTPEAILLAANVLKADNISNVREVCSVATDESSSVLINMVSPTDPIL
jgi:hypothetical protein